MQPLPGRRSLNRQVGRRRAHKRRPGQERRASGCVGGALPRDHPDQGTQKGAFLVGGEIKSQGRRKTFGVHDPSFQLQCAASNAKACSAGEAQHDRLAEVDQKSVFADVFGGTDKKFVACTELDRKAELDTRCAIGKGMIHGERRLDRPTLAQRRCSGATPFALRPSWKWNTTRSCRRHSFPAMCYAGDAGCRADFTGDLLLAVRTVAPASDFAFTRRTAASTREPKRGATHPDRRRR